MRCMAIALASLAVGEVPETRLALIALAAVGIRMAFALTGDDVAFVVGSANTVAVACLATFWAETVCTGHTSVALTTEYVRLALAIATKLDTFFAHRSRWIAVALFGAIEHVNADRVEDLIALRRRSLFVIDFVVCAIAIVGNVFAATIFSWRRSSQDDGVLDARQYGKRVDQNLRSRVIVLRMLTLKCQFHFVDFATFQAHVGQCDHIRGAFRQSEWDAIFA